MVWHSYPSDFGWGRRVIRVSGGTALHLVLSANGRMNAASGASYSEHRVSKTEAESPTEHRVASEPAKRRRTKRARLCASRARKTGARLSAQKTRRTSRLICRCPARTKPNLAATVSRALTQQADAAASAICRRTPRVLRDGSAKTMREPVSAVSVLVCRRTFRAVPTGAGVSEDKVGEPFVPTKRATRARPANETETVLAATRAPKPPNVT